MNYLGRPVLTNFIDWSEGVSKQFSFDLREAAIGFGAEFFNAYQQYVIQGYQFSLFLKNEEIAAFDSFTAALFGRLQGFWLPTPFEALEIVAVTSGTVFDITDQRLRDTFADHPDLYLFFKGDNGSRCAKIATVVSIGGGKERVTLTGALDPIPSVNDYVSRLHYVRLADDTENATVIAEGRQQREIKVVELPTEYTTVETGERPLFLFHFWADEPINAHWRYTSFAANIASAGQLYTAFPLMHGAIKDSVKLDAQSVDLECKFDESHPLAALASTHRPINLEIFKVQYDDLDTQEKIFTGVVRRVDDQGDKLTARVTDYLGAVLSRSAPAMMIQPDDNYDVYDQQTGNVPEGVFDTTGVVVAAHPEARPPYITVDLENTDSLQLANWLTANWFADGLVDIGIGLTYRTATVLSSTHTGGTYRLKLEINQPLSFDGGESVRLVPGYDGKIETRERKFRDFANFGGFRAIPDKNLSLKAIDDAASLAQGGKK